MLKDDNVIFSYAPKCRKLHSVRNWNIHLYGLSATLGKENANERISSYVSKFILHIEFSLILISYHSVNVMSDVIQE